VRVTAYDSELFRGLHQPPDCHASSAAVRYRHRQITWGMRDRYERLVTVAVEVLATPY
jgi:hypothetical protein